MVCTFHLFHYGIQICCLLRTTSFQEHRFIIVISLSLQFGTISLIQLRYKLVYVEKRKFLIALRRYSTVYHVKYIIPWISNYHAIAHVDKEHSEHFDGK